MRGLLYKDMILIWRECRNMLLLCLVFLFIGVFTENFFFAAFTIFYISVLPVTAMGIDEAARWDRYAITMPLNRRDLVGSRYLLAFLGMLTVALTFILFNCVVLLFKGRPAAAGIDIAGFLVAISVVLMFLTLYFPICFKVGVVKSRSWYMLIIVLFFIIFLGISYMDLLDLEDIYSRAVKISSWIAFFISIAFYFCSYLISLVIYSKREL
ncbi:MAG: ABC-2 transporter permease [Bacillota bacterium]|nr:ABC-2 transporter permease [Bacillota bacterium]